MAKMAFLAVNNYFLVRFQKYQKNNNCVFIVFKAESEPKHEEIFFYKWRIRKTIKKTFASNLIKNDLVSFPRSKFKPCVLYSHFFLVKCSAHTPGEVHTNHKVSVKTRFLENSGFPVSKKALSLFETQGESSKFI